VAGNSGDGIPSFNPNRPAALPGASVPPSSDSSRNGVVTEIIGPSRNVIVGVDDQGRHMEVGLPLGIPVDHLTVEIVPPPQPDKRIDSSVVEILLVDEYGYPVSHLDENIHICLHPNEEDNVDDLCLGYWNEETNEWKCQDECLDESSDGTVCGTTDHLTNFALLLDGSRGGYLDNKCGRNSEYAVFGWLTLAFVIAALVCICFGAIASELSIQRKRRELAKQMKDFSQMEIS